ncbi:DUF1850 domain-containing protein [Desulfocucumis palustris]|uniref:DUF1850 domain-containing protein n=1 Tax=Desulfocucumis palustris TaxID=1898651 RepID=A0A2L2XFE9_9FIRM|nr:DUF1850 domain-containing protein [Desulfocucumis palustris]
MTIAIILFFKMPYLVVADLNGKTVLQFSLAVDKGFSLYYVHSVQKTPVWEYYSLDSGDRLALNSTVYDSLGVGLPFLAGDGKLTEDGGKFILTGINRRFREVNIRAVPLARQALIYRGRMYYYNDYFASGALVNIKVRRLSAVDIISQSIRGRKGYFFE